MATASCLHATLFPPPSALSTSDKVFLFLFARFFFVFPAFCFPILPNVSSKKKKITVGLRIDSRKSFAPSRLTTQPFGVFSYRMRHCLFSPSVGARVGVWALRRSGRTARPGDNCGFGKDWTEEHDKQRPEVGWQPKTCSRFRSRLRCDAKERHTPARDMTRNRKPTENLS